jgi:carboxyl-terminal processing protease
MSRRNLLIIFLVSAVSLLCHQRADRNRYASTLAEAMHLIDRRYVEEVAPRELYENAMRGMAEGLDPYSAYIKPSEYKQLLEGLEQKFGGIGIVVELNPETKRLTVMTPLIDTPAYRAGMKTGDIILKINGRDTSGMTLKGTVDLIQGKPGEIVRLTVLHLGEEEPVELEIERAIIPIDSVLGDRRREDGTWDFSLPDHPRITYLRLVTFGDRTVEELSKVLKSRAVQGLIIDLRDDAGGSFSAAVKTCELFVAEGEIVSTRGRGGHVLRTYAASGKPLLDPHVPMAVLVNRYSASASEVVAACLQDHHRAKIIGQRTFGKGTVQNILDLEGGRSALKLTTSSYWRPSGKNIHRRKGAKEEADWGVRPDPGFEVAVTEAEADKVRKQRRQRDLGHDAEKLPAAEEQNGQDSQNAQPVEDRCLYEAIEYLESQLPSEK